MLLWQVSHNNYSILTFDKTSVGILYLVQMQDFPKNEYFLPPDTHTNVPII